ncbi:MAG: SDR family oxidoreductase [Methanobacterium sp.]|nr:SDR family oxidoreductase [Methanobacterium sp.]
MKNKRVVVTGGLGFIGSHIVEKLHVDNEIVVVDDESTGNIKNIEHLDIENIDVVFDSITKTDLNTIFENTDYVIHQAALPSVPRSVKDPLSSNHVNVTGTLKVLIAARDCNVKKVVWASSSSAYGDTPTLPKVEDMPVNPKSPYAITKVTGEFYSKTFSELYDLPTVSLRYFNVFGPRQNPKSQYAAVIPKFISAIIKDQNPVVFGDGTQSRDFTFVSNVVNANILACESSMNGVYNVACGKRITINQLIELINEILGKNISPQYTSPRPGDVKHSLADISKISNSGYKCEYNLREGLEKTISYFSNLAK